MSSVIGLLCILIFCPILGGLPLIEWLFEAVQRRSLQQVGTGNISVSAAFYHGGVLLGCGAVGLEALKGLAAVWVTRFFFPNDPVWELLALMALVMGRYWMGKGAGTTNVVWGYGLHDPLVAAFTFLIGGIGFTIFRERRQGKVAILILFPLLTLLLHPLELNRVVAATILGGIMGWIYHKIPDDLDLPLQANQGGSSTMFQFFRGDGALLTLDRRLRGDKVGGKAATLCQLKRWGFPVPHGWILLPGDDPQVLFNVLEPWPNYPLIVRSSAIGEDAIGSSAAGQYISIPHITNAPTLQSAITQCLASYTQPNAVQYRWDRGVPDGGMAVLIQKQILGVFSGVAFSRDPIKGYGEDVVIEALPGDASRVVSGQVTPEQYRISIAEPLASPDAITIVSSPSHPDVPNHLIQSVARLVRELEIRFHGIPQDVEWTYDGEQVWILQSRPITTLFPIWTRKIAAEVIPGFIRPLTWSINRPLTCGVWGKIFTIVLGKRAQGLDFEATATLHSSRAYFNASLLGEIFQRMGLPPESLEFLTRGAKFSKPPLWSTLVNVPGLLRLGGRELSLESDFKRLYGQQLAPLLQQLTETNVREVHHQSPQLIGEHIEKILQALTAITYFSILVPLSVAIRQALSPKSVHLLDNGKSPEIAALRSLNQLAEQARPLLNSILSSPTTTLTPSLIFATLEHTSLGQDVVKQFNQFLQQYGYLSEVGTDIAVPTWSEDPQVVQQLWLQILINPPPSHANSQFIRPSHTLQRRVDLKGQVTEVYNQLLAHLRWNVVALEQQWISLGWIDNAGDIFFLEWDEIRHVVNSGQPVGLDIQAVVQERQSRWHHDQQFSAPMLVYGKPNLAMTSQHQGVGPSQLQGIGASPGLVEGRIRLMPSFQSFPDLEDDTILVVPYTDSGWAPLLARARGLIAEVGGRLSHGAIVAREYGIPAVMDVNHAMELLENGQWVRLDGQSGLIEILDKTTPSDLN